MQEIFGIGLGYKNLNLYKKGDSIMKCNEANKVRFERNIFEDFSLAKKIKKPLQEQDILYLQDKFMVPGIHHMKVDSVIAGRFIINSILNSLNYYKNVACLSTFHLPIPEPIDDIYKELAKENCIQNPTTHLIEFFLEQFYNDFLWIEISHDLSTSAWYPLFEQQITNLHLEKLMPIIIVSYDDFF